METITLHSRVGADGLLKLQVPMKLTNTDLDVVLVVQPVVSPGLEQGWPPGFFEQTYGSFRDQSLVRESQGETTPPNFPAWSACASKTGNK